LVIVEAAARMVGADRAYIERELARQLEETERRRVAYRIGEPVPLKGRTVIVVNDGIATGGTVRAALKALAHAGPARIVLALPVAPRDTLLELHSLCGDVLCLSSPEPFYAVGAHYRDFTQTEGKEVVQLLSAAQLWVRESGPPHGDFTPAQLRYRLIGLIQWKARHHRANFSLADDFQEAGAILTGEIGDTLDMPLAPQIRIGECRNIAHMDSRADHPFASSHGLESLRNQCSDRGEQDGCIQERRRQCIRPSSPLATEGSGEILPCHIVGLGEGKNFAALP
jgi:hypothetical protein